MKVRMHVIWPLVIGSFALLPTAVATPSKPMTTVSAVPLTTEQVAIYRTVLEDFLKDSKDRLNVANKSEPLDESGPFSGGACVQEFHIEVSKDLTQVIHPLDEMASLKLSIVLVDPQKQRKQIQKNDPDNLMKKSIDDHQKLTDNDVANAVGQAFRTALFTLSEIAFDKEHRYALVSYSFYCGRLCGNGKTLILERTGDAWKIAKTCGNWVS
jgi:hypothetical protein